MSAIKHRILNGHPILGYFISVSTKGFYKKQNLIDFLCETLGRDVTPQSLQNRHFQLDKHRLEKAIRGKNAYDLSCIIWRKILYFYLIFTRFLLCVILFRKFCIIDQIHLGILVVERMDNTVQWIAELFANSYSLDSTFPTDKIIHPPNNWDRCLPLEQLNKTVTADRNRVWIGLALTRCKDLLLRQIISVEENNRSICILGLQDFLKL